MIHASNTQVESNFDDYKERLTNFSNEFEFGLFLFIAKKSLVWIILFFGLSIFSAFLYVRYTAPVFQASTVLQISKNNNARKVLQVEQLYDDQSLLGDIELIRSKLLIQKAVENLPFQISYFVKGDILNDEKYRTSIYEVELTQLKDSTILGTPVFLEFYEDGYLKVEAKDFVSDREQFFDGLIETPYLNFYIKYNNRKALFEKEFTSTYFFKLNHTSELVRKFYRNLEVNLLNPQAKTISISMRYTNPLVASDFVNQLAYEYIKYDLHKRSQSSKSILEFIDIQLDTVFTELNETELMLQNFKKEHKVTNLEEISNTYVNNYARFEEELMQLDLEINVLKQIHESNASDKIELYNLIPFLAGTEYQELLGNMISTIHNLEIEKEEYLYTGTRENERIEAINYQLEIQKKLLYESIVNLENRLQSKKFAIEEKIKEYEKLFVNMPTQEMEYTRLKRLYEINEKYYTLLLEKQIEYRISNAGFVTNNQILEPANVSRKPIAPKSNVIYISMTGVAFIISVIFIMVRYLTHNNITSINEITRLSNASIGSLGIVPKFEGNVPDSMLLVDQNPKSMLAESFRSIRSNLQFVNSNPNAKLISITSTVSGEGKTFIAINLGGIIAFSNKKVIILDLDMRRPKIHKAFGVENGIGMSSLLIGKGKLEESIHKSRVSNLDFVTAGPIPPNPSELLLNHELDQIIAELSKSYDYIITDNPPVGLVTDGIVLIQKADFPIYVFRADYSKKQFVQNVDRLKNESLIHRISVILNSVDIKRNRYGYNYGYGYGYGYGYSYGYYDDRNKRKGNKVKDISSSLSGKA